MDWVAAGAALVVGGAGELKPRVLPNLLARVRSHAVGIVTVI